MINKITETNLDGEVTTLLDVSEVTAEPINVANGYAYVNSEGRLVYGTGLVGRNVLITTYPKIECCRFRSVPTPKEYQESFNGESEPVLYDSIYPIVKGGSELFSTPTWGDNLTEFQTNHKYNYPVFDCKYKGYVVASIPFRELSEEEIESFGLTVAEFPIYREVVKGIMTKYSRFVMPSEFGYCLTQFVNDRVIRRLNYTNFNGISVDSELINGGVTWKYDITKAQYLLDKLYNIIIRQVKLLYPKMQYEMSKFLIKQKLFTESNTTSDVNNLINALAQLRTANHIDTSTLMTSANTPEIISGQTPQETLNSYMSSLFKTDTNREDDYTSAYGHFEDMFSELISSVAFACLIPN